jgi:hypothetical protein
MKETESGQFVDLASYKSADVPPQIRGSIIKASQVSIERSVLVGSAQGTKNDPVILLHRDGERVIAAEFMCKCGRCATLHLDYGEE